MLRNEFANLPQQVQFRPGCQAFAYAFYPCRVTGLRSTFQLSFKSDGMAVHAYHVATQRVRNEILGPGLILEFN